MIDSIIRFSLVHKALVLLAALGVLALGAYETSRMPVDVFPDLTAPTVTVLAEAHGMAPEEVERLVTRPIETALNGAAGVRRIRSSTGVGIAVIWVEFDWDSDIPAARQVVSERLQLARSQLPSDLEPPALGPVSSVMGEILFLALTSERHTPMELKTVADWTVRRRILAVPGVSQVIPLGGETQQFQVLLDPARLFAYDLDTRAVLSALREADHSVSAGFLVLGGQEHLIHGVGRVQGIDDVKEAVLAVRAGQPVRVRDIADVEIGPALRRGTGAFGGAPAVVIGVQKQPHANTLELTERLDEVFRDIEAALPEGMKLHSDIFRQADFIAVAVENVAASLRDGALLVVLILILFLASARATLISALAIPLSLVVAALVLERIGVSLNTMTLGGMAISVGALVDDAIIDVENVIRRLRMNAAVPASERRPPLEVVFDASREIRTSIVFATLIIVLVFLPLFFLSGVEGRLLVPLGLAYVISLGASLVVALTVTPALCLLLLPEGKEIRKPEAPLLTWLKLRYAPLLDAALERWRAILALGAAALVASLLALLGTGQSFLPDFNEGTLTISAVTLPGIALEESDRLAAMVDRILLSQPEVTSVARRTGRAELDEHAQGVNASEIDVSLQLESSDKEAFLERLRAALSAVPGTNITIGQPISHRIDHMLSGTRANIAVKLFGPDLATLRRLAKQVEAEMKLVDGVVDLSLEQQSEIPFVRVRFDRRAIASYGLTVGAVAEVLETAFAGTVVAQVDDGVTVFDLVVKQAPRTDAPDLEPIRALRVRAPGGAEVPLYALASIVKDTGPSTISREDVQRKAVVMANVSGRDVGSVVGDIRARVSESVVLPSGYSVEYGGQFESAESAQSTLLLLGALVTLGIFALLMTALGDGRDALLVMLNLPLALIGGVAGVYLSGGVLSIAALIGFITLFGIATRNGLMLVTHVRHLIYDEGELDLRAAVRRGSLERLAPILMTALASALALVPLALRGGEPGSEIQAPMAIVILCGLLSSTVLNMLVVPALYLRFGSAARRSLNADATRA